MPAARSLVKPATIAPRPTRQLSTFTMYVVDPTEENLNELYRGIGRASKELGGIATGTTLVGVTALSVPGAVYEVDAIAVVESGDGR